MATSQVTRSEAQRGPVRVIAEVAPAKARLSDQPKLTLRIETTGAVQLQKPEFGKAIGDFLVRDFHERLPRVENGREILEQVYTLEPTRTGRLSIDPIRIGFNDTRRWSETSPHAVETEALTVEITSVVESDTPSLADLRPLAGPVEVPEPRRLNAWWLAVPVAVLVAVGGWFWSRRRRKPAEERALSPQELARIELERLLAEGLAQRDVKLFYVELTGLVRRYIERTTGIRAPEQTTEEFLREIAGRQTFPPDETRRLRQFLESADLVKFAAHQPRTEDVDQSVQRAMRFIGLERLEVAA
jgi:hypothetical protein